MRTKRYGSFSVTLFVAVVILTGLHTQAQQTMTSANLSGHVEDAGGARIRNASVTARSISTGQEKATVCDSEGQFRLAYLMVGTYDITVWSPGFATLKRQLTLTIGQSLDVPFRLNVEGMAANVDVMTEAPVVETVRTQLAETLLPREIDSLPLNGRNYLDLAALTPGVSRSNPTANQRFPETSAVPGSWALDYRSALYQQWFRGRRSIRK